MSTPEGLAPQDVPPAANTQPSAAGTPPCILVVDDDFINQRVMINLLKRKGWSSVVANSGKEGLAKLTGQRFDLILLDIQMPEMDGFQTAELIRKHEADTGTAERIPIVALTALRQAHTRERCLEVGMDDHLQKPVDTAQLYAVIQRILKLPD